jgi:hypothetical protein
MEYIYFFNVVRFHFCCLSKKKCKIPIILMEKVVFLMFFTYLCMENFKHYNHERISRQFESTICGLC